jgi:uncharacterized protein (DUF1499 family)
MASSQKGIGFIIWGTSISVVGALVVILAGYGYQWGWWHFSTGFSLIPWGTGGVILGGILALAGFLRSNKKMNALSFAAGFSMLLTIAAITNIGYWYGEVKTGYPPIHDITTDTVNPPQFDAIVPLRKNAPNSLEYDAKTAAIQKEFYPDIKPLYVSMNYDEAYDRALKTARSMGWQLVGESRQDGRIEAYEKLLWFGFIDDVMIKIDTTDTGSKIDMRSISRLGKGDLGVNAKRIRSYFKKFKP